MPDSQHRSPKTNRFVVFTYILLASVLLVMSFADTMAKRKTEEEPAIDSLERMTIFALAARQAFFDNAFADETTLRSKHLAKNSVAAVNEDITRFFASDLSEPTHPSVRRGKKVRAPKQFPSVSSVAQQDHLKQKVSSYPHHNLALKEFSHRLLRKSIILEENDAGRESIFGKLEAPSTALSTKCADEEINAPLVSPVAQQQFLQENPPTNPHQDTTPTEHSHYLIHNQILMEENSQARLVLETDIFESHGARIEVERGVLLKLFEATGGSGWKNTTGWNEEVESQHCEWYGVSCSGEGLVIKLVFYDNNLIGTIPTDLGELTELRSIQLSANSLAGTIPTELGVLNKLEKMYLFFNSITGTIPTELGALMQLKELYLPFNSITGTIPTELGVLAKLNEFYLSFNIITGNIPTELGKLTQLLYFDLSYNSLSGLIPAELEVLTELQYLLLQSNNLSGTIPTELKVLTELQYLLLNSNNLSGTIPTEIGVLDQLEMVDLGFNNITGTIPTELGMLTRLHILGLYVNEITGSIPTEFGALTQLQMINLQINSLTSHIPTELGVLTKLRDLRLSYNNFRGSIPSELGVLTELKQIQTVNNSLTGHIPTELGALIKLEDLGLAFNKLRGIIPSEFGVLAELRTLSLHNNNLSGHIPTEFGTLVKLQELFLVSNRLSGMIPSELGILTGLKSLDLRANSLTGHLPAELWDLIQLVELHLSFNNLNTFIPNELGNLTLLHSLSLSPNNLKGTIPTKLGRLTHLKGALDLSSNNLTGTVPTELGNLQNLQELDFSMNHLTGPLPTQLRNMSSLVLLNMSYNAFSSFSFGEEWRLLETCDLSHNQIKQEIPAEFAALSSLKNLILSYNSFYGSIPNSIRSLIRIERLHLDYNYLFGTIPDDILSLVRLRELKLSHSKQDQCFNIQNCTILNSYKPGDIVCCESGLACSVRMEIKQSSITTCLSTGLDGTIPASFGMVPYLEILDLSSNYLSGEIPPEIGELSRLKILDLSKNMLYGFIPSALGALTDATVHLKGNDQIRNRDGNKLAPLSLCIGVPGSDFFNDTIWCPPERNALQKFYDQSKGQEWTDNAGWANEYNDYCHWHGITCNDRKHVTKLLLNNNGLSGRITSHISNLRSLEEIDLHDNDLKGSIPNEIGELLNLSYVRFSFNTITGTAPEGFQNLSKLKLLHLHSNRLHGTIPILMFKEARRSSFIADCGSPSDFETPLNCPSCTMCCNSLQQCDTQETTTNYTIGIAIVMASILVFFILISMVSFLPKSLWNLFSIVNRCKPTGHELNAVGKESVYCFFLSSSLVGWLLGIIVLVVQALCYALFVDDASFEFSNEKAWVYSYVCPRNSEECHYTSDVGVVGWLFFAVFTAIYILTDLANGLLLLWMFATKQELSLKSFRCFFSGLCLFSITIFALYASAVYNIAISRTNTELIINTVIVIFVNELDERLYKSLRVVCPRLVKRITKEIRTAYPGHKIGVEVDSDSIKELETFINDLKEETNSIRNEHSVEINDLRKEHTNEIMDLIKKHTDEINDLKECHAKLDLEVQRLLLRLMKLGIN